MFSPGFLFATDAHFPRTFVTASAAARHITSRRAAAPAGRKRRSGGWVLPRVCAALRGLPGRFASLCALFCRRCCRFAAAAAAALPRGGLVSWPPSSYVPCAAYPFPAAGRPLPRFRRRGRLPSAVPRGPDFNCSRSVPRVDRRRTALLSGGIR